MEVTVEAQAENHGGDAFRKSDTFELSFLFHGNSEPLGKIYDGHVQPVLQYTVDRGAACASDDDCGRG